MTKDSGHCSMIDQGYPRGSCLVEASDGKQKLACSATLRHSPETGYERLIKSLLLSRPEDYMSIYQSGCNHTCLKCHSHEFSKVVTGEWMSAEMIADIAKRYPFRTVSISFMAFVVSQPPSAEILKFFEEEPDIQRWVALYDFSRAFGSEPVCAKLNMTKSRVFNELEKYLGKYHGIKFESLLCLESDKLRSRK